MEVNLKLQAFDALLIVFWAEKLIEIETGFFERKENAVFLAAFKKFRLEVMSKITREQIEVVFQQIEINVALGDMPEQED